MKPVWLLNHVHGRWELVGKYSTDEQAETVARRILGAWKWWGPVWSAQLLLDGTHHDVVEAMAKAKVRAEKKIAKSAANVGAS